MKSFSAGHQTFLTSASLGVVPGYSTTKQKWDPRADPMIFIGYEHGSKAFRLWNPKTHSVVVSATVCFNEREFPNRRDAPCQTSKPKPSSSREPELHPEELEIPWSFFDDIDLNPLANLLHLLLVPFRRLLHQNHQNPIRKSRLQIN